MYHQGVKKNIVPRPAGKKSPLKDIEPPLNKIFSTRGVTENEQFERTFAS